MSSRRPLRRRVTTLTLVNCVHLRPSAVSLSVPVSNPPIWQQPDLVFAVLAGVFGLAILLVNAPFQAPDESDHYYRAYQVSEGGWVATRINESAGGHLPEPVHDVTDVGPIPFHPDNKIA